MKKGLISFGCFVAAIGGIVVIKMLNLPVVLTILLVAALLVGVIWVVAGQMGDSAPAQKEPPASAPSSSEKA